MATAQRTDAVIAAIAPVLERLGLDLFDVELVGGGRASMLRLFVDRADVDSPDGRGIDLAAIAEASAAVSLVLDADPAVAEALPGPYDLEVSSPGLERTLRTPAHFRWAVGRAVSVKTRTESGGLRRRGTVAEADDAGVDIDFDGSRERLAYDEITQARTVFEWGAQPAPERKRRKHATKKQEVAR